MSRKIGLGVLAVILVGVGVWRLPSSPAPATATHLTPATGAFLKERIAKSKVSLVNLWASWCEPCKAEFPDILKLRDKYQAQGLQVLFVSMDNKPEWPDAERFLDTQHVAFETFVMGESPDKLAATLDPHWQGAVPSSFLFTADGRLIDSWQGETRLEEFEGRIHSLLTQ